MQKTENAVLDTYYKQYDNDPDFVAEGMAIKIVEDALRIMKQKGLTRSDLANKMGVPRAQVSRLLNAPPNLTLRSIARLAVALGVKPNLHFLPRAQELGLDPGDITSLEE